MRFTRHVSMSLVRDAVKAARDGRQLDMIKALHALGEELDEIDNDEQAEAKRELARANPPLTTQKVIAVLRKAKLDIRRVDSGRAGIGGATGFGVEYGDSDTRTWVAVEYHFVWNWDYLNGIKEGDRETAQRKRRTEKLIAAKTALEAAGLKVTLDTRRGSVHAGWKVTAA